MSNQNLKITLHRGAPGECPGEALVVAVFDQGAPQPALDQCSDEVVAVARAALTSTWMRGRLGETLLLPLPTKASGATRLLLIGLGKPEKLTAETLRATGGRLVTAANGAGVASLGCVIPRNPIGPLKPAAIAEALAEGAWLGNYRFDRFRSDPEEQAANRRTLRALTLSLPKLPKGKGLKQRLQTIRTIVRGVHLARDLGNLPPNLLTPEAMAAQARKLGRHLPIQCTVLDEKELHQEGMRALLGVGQGSVHPPRLIVLEYRGHPDPQHPPLAVVGKAITFDSGGISIKPAAGMEEMKFDMAGGAAVLGFLQAVATLRLPINLVGVVPAAENMPSGSAQRPGDIVRTARGHFVEIVNTDAEGRLVLADALHYVERYHPHTIIDLATLTGACVVALGSQAAGLLGNNPTLLRAIRRAGRDCGERVWPLPMFDEYQELLKSTVADFKNAGNREAGAISGACFLSRFVGQERRWAHLDIAGTAWDNEGKRPHIPKGAVGFGVRLLCRLVVREWL